MASSEGSSSPEPDVPPLLVTQSVGQGEEHGTVIPLKPVVVTDTAPKRGGESRGRPGSYIGPDDSNMTARERSGSMNITPAYERGHSHSGMSSSSDNSQGQQDPEESFTLRKVHVRR